MSKKITKEAIPQIVKMYTDEMIPMIKIAEVFGVSRTAIHKLIRKTGTPTQKGVASRRLIECHGCHAKFEITRARCRERENDRNFCKRSCYYEWLQRNATIVDRDGSRKARAIVESIYGPLPEGSIVHHIDCNAKNNNISNLMLLKDQADHNKVHHKTAVGVVPLFVGADVVLPTSSNKFSFYDAGYKVLNHFGLKDVVFPNTNLTMIQVIQFLIASLKTSQVMRDIKDEIRRQFGTSKTLEDIFNDQANYVAFYF